MVPAAALTSSYKVTDPQQLLAVPPFTSTNPAGCEIVYTLYDKSTSTPIDLVNDLFFSWSPMNIVIKEQTSNSVIGIH